MDSVVLGLWPTSQVGSERGLLSPLRILFGGKAIKAIARRRTPLTLGQRIGARDYFHLIFICRYLRVSARSETALRKLYSMAMSTTNATNVVEKLLRGRRFRRLNSLNFNLCSWCHMVPHISFDPVWLPSPFILCVAADLVLALPIEIFIHCLVTFRVRGEQSWGIHRRFLPVMSRGTLSSVLSPLSSYP